MIKLGFDTFIQVAIQKVKPNVAAAALTQNIATKRLHIIKYQLCTLYSKKNLIAYVDKEALPCFFFLLL